MFRPRFKSGAYRLRELFILTTCLWMSIASLSRADSIFGGNSSGKAAKQNQPNTYKYALLIRAGVLHKSDNNTFSASIINAASINHQGCIGVGVGWDKYIDGKGLPMFIDTRLQLEDLKVSPLFWGDFGYTLIWVDGLPKTNRGGIFFGAGTGVKIISTNENISLLLELGYKRQHATGIEYSGYYTGYYYTGIGNDKKIVLESFTFSIGFVF